MCDGGPGRRPLPNCLGVYYIRNEVTALADKDAHPHIIGRQRGDSTDCKGLKQDSVWAAAADPISASSADTRKILSLFSGKTDLTLS